MISVGNGRYQLSMDPNEVVRARLQKYQLEAKKSWGQNFLVNPKAYEAIVRACDLGPLDVAVEIGAGLGTLTECLLESRVPVVAIEHEPDMCHVLSQELSSQPHFHLRQQDAMTLDLAQIAAEFKTQKLVLVGNLPYQISTPLLFHLLRQSQFVKRIVIMVQKEVAERLASKPDTDGYGALSAQVQLLADVEKIYRLGPGSFLPQPKVDSMVVRITPLETPRFPVNHVENYARIVRAAFSQRRKMLRNTLQACFAERTESVLESVGIDPRRRAETMTVKEFVALANQLPVESV